MQPPPPPPQRPDSADAFFQSFDANSPVRSTATTTARMGPPGQPPGQQNPQQRRGPPVGPPPFRPPNQQQRPGQPPPAPPQPSQPRTTMQQTSYGASNNASSSHMGYPHNQQGAAAAASGSQPNSYYGAAGSARQPPSLQPSNTATTTAAASNNDWYTPSSGSNHSSGSYGAGNNTMGNMPPPGGAQPAAYGNMNSAPSYNTMEGTMDSSGRGVSNSNMHPSMAPFPSQPASTSSFPQTFVPQANTTNTSSSNAYGSDYFNEKDEASLLEELGVNVEHILAKTKAVVVPFRRFQKQSALADPSMIMEDADLAGPIAFALLLGGELLFTGKLQFGYIYGFGLFGCFSMTVILNLMSPSAVSFWTVTSVLGYALIPVNILAAVKIVLFSFGSSLVRFLALLTVLWSTTASTRLLEVGCGMEHQRFLLAYPIALLYSAFVLITIF